MPELPDVTIYVEALRARLRGQPLEKIRMASPFLLRSVDPPLSEFTGLEVTAVRRMGKRIVLEFDGPLFLVFHLMIAGRFRWDEEPGAKVPGKIGLAAFDFPNGTLLMTEASPKKRASLHAARGEAGLEPFRRDGVEVLEIELALFCETLRSERHTLKRSLTDPHLFSGIGNAYSDEILHRARMSPFKRSDQISDADARVLFDATRAVLSEWIERLREEAGDAFPQKVTAFRQEMAVHGRYKKPCPVCSSPVQRIRYAGNEANYCATCQTGGKLLADRALSRLLKKDWPKTLEELEQRKRDNEI